MKIKVVREGAGGGGGSLLNYEISKYAKFPASPSYSNSQAVQLRNCMKMKRWESDKSGQVAE